MKLKPKENVLCAVVLSSLFLAGNSCFAQTQKAQALSPDDIIQNYTQQVTNPQPFAVKKITVINNSPLKIYPVVRVYNEQDKHEYRIYVGYLYQNQQQFGIPAGTKAIVSIPQQLWNAGRIQIFTEMPEIPQPPKIKNPLQAIDMIANSSNKGDLIYRNDTALGFPLDARAQLAEYTIVVNPDNSDPHVVDYDISYVDDMYLPIAIESDSGKIGYVGTDLTINALQESINNFYQGNYTENYFDKNNHLGWPKFNFSDNSSHDNANYIKIPGGYNVFALKDARSTFNQNSYMLITNLSATNGAEQAVITGLVNRWTGWANNDPAKFCENDKDPKFCQDFSETVQFIWKVVQDNFPHQYNDTQIVQKLLGYEFPANFPPPNYKLPPKFNQPNSFRDAVKSLLRGVPYPFWNYDANTYWYPNPNAFDENNQPNPKQKYNLNPLVWFVHKQLNMSGYGFSIDDDTANVQTPGNGFIIAVGGTEGLPNQNPYKPTA